MSAAIPEDGILTEDQCPIVNNALTALLLLEAHNARVQEIDWPLARLAKLLERQARLAIRPTDAIQGETFYIGRIVVRLHLIDNPSHKKQAELLLSIATQLRRLDPPLSNAELGHLHRLFTDVSSQAEASA